MKKAITDPRQTLTLGYYTNPKSDTFSDLKNSMIKAGYDEVYSDTIHGHKPHWLTENINFGVKAIRKSEKALDKVLSVEIDLTDNSQIDLARLQVDVSKFILKTLARAKYTEDKDLTPPNVQVNIINYNDKPLDTIDMAPSQDAVAFVDIPVDSVDSVESTSD